MADILDALWDTLILFPFLFVLYILIELLEHRTRIGKPSRLLTGRLAPLIGTATGLLPMCGFSVMAAKLYRHRHLTLGTLLAVFIATSDEGLLVLLLSSAAWEVKLYSLLALVGSKLLLGAGIGYLVDLFAARQKPYPIAETQDHVHGEHDHDHEEHVHGHEEHTHVHEEHDHDHEEHTHVHGLPEEEEHAHEEGHCDCAELSVCEHKHESKLTLYLLSPLWHALQVAGFLLLANVLFWLLFFAIGGGDAEAGELAVGAFMQGSGYWYQPLLCVLVGLIPNCASSVVLAETFAIGGINFGGLLGGLVANAGLGYLVLFGQGGRRNALLIVAAMAGIGLAAGYGASALCLLFP